MSHSPVLVYLAAGVCTPFPEAGMAFALAVPRLLALHGLRYDETAGDRGDV
jgi:hypothetical protein